MSAHKLSVVASACWLSACSSAPQQVPLEAPPDAALAPAPAPFDAAPVGWAAVAGLGSDGTTGGDGGEVVEVTTTANFMAQAKLAGPRVILVNGVVGDGERVGIASTRGLR